MMNNESDNYLKEVVTILRYQSLLLKKIYELLLASAAQQSGKGNKKSYQFKTRIDDLQISFGTVVNIAFKWWIATFIIGFVFGCIAGFLSAVFR